MKQRAVLLSPGVSLLALQVNGYSGRTNENTAVAKETGRKIYEIATSGETLAFYMLSLTSTVYNYFINHILQ